MSGGMSIGDFLKHSNRTSGGSRQYLGKWKDTGSVTVWLHPGAGIVSLWRHGFPSIESREDKDTKAKTTEIWTRRVACYEHEDVLKTQNYYDKETNERESPPQVCALCRFIEWVRREVRAGRLPWDYPVFRFEATAGKERELTLHSGGLYNAYAAKGVTDAQKAALKEKRIFLSNAWKENCKAKLEYAFTIIDDGDLKKGIQIAVESNLLGDRVKAVIAKKMEEVGEEEGNPILNPYAIRWKYDEKADFDEKYDAVAMTRIVLRPEVKALMEKAPPDLSGLLQKYNPESLLARMQRHIDKDLSRKVPWDELFAPCIAEYKRQAADQPAAKGAPASAPEVGRGGAVPLPPPQVPRTPAPAPVAPAEESTPLAKVLRQSGYTGRDLTIPGEEDGVACDACEKAIRMDWPACPHCGHKYPEVLAAQAPAAPAAPALPKLPSRAEARAKMQQAPAAAAAPPPAPNSAPGDAGFGDDDDGVPF